MTVFLNLIGFMTMRMLLVPKVEGSSMTEAKRSSFSTPSTMYLYLPRIIYRQREREREIYRTDKQRDRQRTDIN